MLELGIRIFCVVARGLYFFMKLFPTGKKVTFIIREDNMPSVDVVYLREELQNRLPDYKLVVKCRMFEGSVGAILRYLPSMLVQMFHIATSRLVILDTYCIPISILDHKPGLKVMQIWHAIGLMKKAGYAALGREEGRNEQIAALLRMHRGYTHILASSPACVPAMLEVFGYGEGAPLGNRAALQEVLIRALPRVDYLQNEAVRAEVRSKVRNAYPYFQGKKVILYAPTHRKDKAGLYEGVGQLIEAVNEANANGGNYVLVIKFHPLQHGIVPDWPATLNTVSAAAPGIQEGSILFDTVFSAIEIGMAADACISDYSSIVYEFMILDKPTYFFGFDLERYERARGFCIDYQKEVPGVVYQDSRSLLAAIARAEYSPSRQHAFLTKYVTLDRGGSTKALADDIARIVGDDGGQEA